MLARLADLQASVLMERPLSKIGATKSMPGVSNIVPCSLQNRPSEATKSRQNRPGGSKINPRAEPLRGSVKNRVREDFQLVFEVCAQTRNLDFERPYGVFSPVFQESSGLRARRAANAEKQLKSMNFGLRKVNNRCKIIKNCSWEAVSDQKIAKIAEDIAKFA